MAKESFNVRRIENPKGIGFDLTYANQGVLFYEHLKNNNPLAENTFVLNFNIYIPSFNELSQNVIPVVNYLKRLEQKKVRGIVQAMKDIGEYEHTIFAHPSSKIHQSFAQLFNFGAVTSPFPFDEKEIIRRFLDEDPDAIRIQNPFSSCIIDRPHEEAHSYHLAQKPQTIVRTDGYDAKIVEELADLVVEIAAVRIPEREITSLKASLTEILNSFQPVIMSEIKTSNITSPS